MGLKPIKSKKMVRESFEVGISNVEVDLWYYYFDYKVFRNGNLVKEGRYESDHAWQDNPKLFMKHLLEGGAVNLALEQII